MKSPIPEICRNCPALMSGWWRGGRCEMERDPSECVAEEIAEEQRQAEIDEDAIRRMKQAEHRKDCLEDR